MMKQWCKMNFLFQGRIAPVAEPECGNIPVLLEKIGKGEQEALAELYDRTSSLLFGLALKILEDPTVAEEALLDTYLYIWNHPVPHDADPQPLDRLLRTVRTYAIARLGENCRRQRQTATSSEIAAGTVVPAEQKVARFQLEALAPMQREILDWAFFSGLSANEIAARIGTPAGAVRAHVRMGLNRLCKTLEINEPEASAS